MNRPTPFAEAPLDLKETAFSTSTNLDFKTAEEPINTSFPVDWDDFDTGSLDD